MEVSRFQAIWITIVKIKENFKEKLHIKRLFVDMM